MLSDYDRQAFNDLIDELEADDPEFVAAFRARKPPPAPPPRSRLFRLCVAIVVFSAALAILLVPAAQLGTAVLPAVAIIGCAWYLHQFPPPGQSK